MLQMHEHPHTVPFFLCRACHPRTAENGVLNVYVYCVCCFRLVDVHVELCTSVYGSYTYKEAALHVA